MKGRRGALGQYHASMSNNRGHDFEEAIRQACLLYANQGRAKVEKTPEPFRVLEKREGGIFVGRFTAHAQPDFQGTLDGGRSIIFEAKYTTTDAMKRDVLTETQRRPWNGTTAAARWRRCAWASGTAFSSYRGRCGGT